MTDDAYGATVAKRRLSRRLAELRLASGHTANHVCDILNWGRGKVGRFEANQWKRPEMSDIRDLLRIYGVDGTEGEDLEELAIRARARPWWRDYSDIFENEFPGFEWLLMERCRAPAVTDYHPAALGGDHPAAVIRSGASPACHFSGDP